MEEIRQFLISKFDVDVSNGSIKIFSKHVIVPLNDPKLKHAILKEKKNKLENSSIFIENDCTNKEKCIDWQLRKAKKLFEDEGKHVIWKPNMIIVASCSYHWNSRDNKLEKQDRFFWRSPSSSTIRYAAKKLFCPSKRTAKITFWNLHGLANLDHSFPLRSLTSLHLVKRGWPGRHRTLLLI